jgi:hypothetical protein
MAVDEKRSNVERRSGKDRRSGVDTRSEEEKRQHHNGQNGLLGSKLRQRLCEGLEGQFRPSYLQTLAPWLRSISGPWWSSCR